MIVESVTFLVSLTDSVVAANMVDMEAFAAIGLVGPFFSVSTFFAALLNSGTVTNYAKNIGRFDKRRAYEFFSQGVILAIATGLLLKLILQVIKPAFLGSLSVTPDVESYLNEYYDIILFYFLFAPISALLDNMVVTDGGERLSAVANTLQIVGNVVLSFVLSGLYGIKGIAIATVVCKAGFVVLICFWFFSSKNTIRFIRFFSLQDVVTIVKRGVVRAWTFAMAAGAAYFLNMYVLNNYGMVIFKVWTIDQKVLGLSSIFLGMAMTLQPLISTLMGEKNTKSIHFFANKAAKDIVIAGCICSAFILCFTPLTLRLFGVKEGVIFEESMTAVRITCPSLIFTAIAIFFFIYYYLIEKNLLALAVGSVKDFICPVGVVLLVANVWRRSQNSLWAGIVASSILTLVICALIILIRYGKSMFPFLLSKEEEKRIFIYSYEIDEENVAGLSATAGRIIKEWGFSRRLQGLVSLCLEDLLNLIREKNSPRNSPLLSESVLIIRDNGVGFILRDNGKIFMLTDEDAEVHSFCQYIVGTVIHLVDYKSYVSTMGYNRNVLFFLEEEGEGGAGE